MDKLEKRIDARMQVTDAQLALYKTTSDLQGFALAETQKKQAEQSETSTSLVISAIELQRIATRRMEAIGRVQLEVKTAPPPLSNLIKGIIQSIASGVIGGITGGLSKVIEGAFPAAAVAVAALTKAGSAALATGGIAGLASLLADPDKPEVFFLALNNAANAEMGVLLKVIGEMVAIVPSAANPSELARKIRSWVAQAATEAYDTQYRRTLDAYYDVLATATLRWCVPRGLFAPDPSLGDPVAAARGLITFEGTHTPDDDGNDNVTELESGHFNGAKTEEHRKFVGGRALKDIAVPMRFWLRARAGSMLGGRRFHIVVVRRGEDFTLEGNDSYKWWAALVGLHRVPLTPSSEAIRRQVFTKEIAKLKPEELEGWSD